MSSIFVIVYPQQQFYVSWIQRLTWDVSASSPLQLKQADPHYIGKFGVTPYNYRLTIQLNSWDQGGGASHPAQLGQADPHYVGSFSKPPFWKAALSSWDTAPTEAFGPVEANPHFIAKFGVLPFQRPINSWDVSTSAPAQLGQADPHFVGRFQRQPYFQALVASSAADVQPLLPQVQSEPHFIGKFSPMNLAWQIILGLNSWDTAVGAVAPPPPPPRVIAPAGGAFDAGEVGDWYGKWYNLAFKTHGSGKRRKRETELGRELAALAYADEAQEVRAALPQAAAEEADELVTRAVEILRREKPADEVLALRRLMAHHAAFAKLLEKTRAETERAFIAALVERATVEHRQARAAAIRRRIALEDEDLMTLGALL